MYAVWLTSLILIFVFYLTYGEIVRKCCKTGEKLKKTKDSYNCSEDQEGRYQIITNNTDFLRKNISGECIDVSTDVFVFTVKNTQVFEKEKIKNIFPKCCPPNYYYNSILHSCVEKENFVYSIHNWSIFNIGLLDCRIVVDNELNETIDFHYNLLNESSELIRNSSGQTGSFCIDENEKNKLVRRECKDSIEICNHYKCVKKCCPDGQSFVNGAKCYNTYKHGLNLSSLSHSIQNHSAPFAIIHKYSCQKLYVLKYPSYNFSLDNEGVYHQFSKEGEIIKDIGNSNSYCIEHSMKKNAEGYFFFMCFPETENEEKFQYTLWPLSLSCLFLFLTIVVYLIIKETRKMFGKILVNYCLATFFQYAVLTYASAYTNPSTLNCKIRAFVIIFFATASFAWSNIMCWDIWCTFGSTKRFIGNEQRKRDLKKLLLYCLYGWGTPLALTLVILVFYNWKILPHSVQPYLAESRCFFDTEEGNYSKVIFFNLPLLIIEIGNVVLFLKTVIYCLKVKNEINRINDTTKDDKTRKFQSDKERLQLIMKLLVIMGVSFVFEVVSAFFNMSQMGDVLKYTEIVWDFINALQGVFIFIIFICKKKIVAYFIAKFKPTKATGSSVSSSRTQSSCLTYGVPLPMNVMK